MEITWNTDWTGVTRPFQDEVKRKIDRIGRHLPHGKDEAVFLHVSISPEGHNPDYHVQLVVHLPQHTVKAEKTGPDVVDASENAVQAIISELETIKGKNAEGRQRKSRQLREKMKDQGFE
jgi:ribosome-associated translation inhibitor RaiA